MKHFGISALLLGAALPSVASFGALGTSGLTRPALLTGKSTRASSKLSKVYLSTPSEGDDESTSKATDVVEEKSSILPNVDLSNLNIDLSSVNLDFSNILENTDAIQANIFDGELGQRGEQYVIAQVLLVLFVLIGGVPILGDPLASLLGPSLLLTGLGVAVVGVNEMGGSLSPWPVPPSNESNKQLIKSGLFSKVRHPIYSGLLLFSAGLSISTDSANRLLLTAILLYVLDVKSDYEEKKLMEVFPDYAEYQKEVPGKFFPSEITSKLPWIDSD
uniref:Protein-S-isoprenylcysteine O-methyltransferase n=1 Tax=Attheya septentrionalis TaxID=420275 RepID=A0A7S2XU15_9STRA|mmetsp:Transcript_8803/g.15987  ORF Transcript_8803/g.15987 Transcript_8803/m.15987 type:complete len:275 (+) Transcript_8803:129-953(+)